MTDKLIMTTAQRDALMVTLAMATPKTNSALDMLVGGRLIEEVDMLQSLPMVSGEPVATIETLPTTAGSIGQRYINWVKECPPVKTKLYTSPQPLRPITTDMVNEFENALDGGHGWWCDRDARTIMEVALNAVIKHKGAK